MQVLTLKRKEMIPQIEAAHIGAMVRLRRAYDSEASQRVLDRVDSVRVELSERMGTCAGKAYARTARIVLNARLHAINMDELIPTYLHELAHIVANLMLDSQCGHGPAWKSVMKILGISDERCHKMDVSAFTRPQKKFKYDCIECDRVHLLSPAKHKKYQHFIANNARVYRCRCGGTIEHKP